MSEQEEVKTEQQPGEEQPAVEKEAAAAETEPEQKPDTSEGEKPSETTEPTPKEEGATKEGGETPKEGEEASKEGEPAAAKEEEEEEPEEEEPDDGVPIVLVTGASGFIATHIIKQLLEQGRYRVRGTVRNKKREEKVKPLLELVPDAKYPIRLVEADLSKAETWAKAVKRCTYVFHVASPFPAGAANEAVIVKTAVEGTTTVLQACAEAGTVKRVVVTSSVAAVSAGSVGDPEKAGDYVYTEKDWSVEAVCTPYIKSKLKAEQAAWDFVKNLDESKRFELSVVNPGYVQGPLLSANSGEGSKEFCQRILNGKLPAIPDISIAIIDVRDVAAAHIAAMEKSEAAGNRYILSCRTVNFREYATIIGNEFRPQGYKIVSRNLPKAVMWVGKFFDSGLKQMYSSLGKNVQVSNERMVNELGIQPRPVEESIIDTCYSLVELGLAKRTPGYLGHPSKRPPPPEPQPEKEEVPAAKDEGQKEPEEGKKEETQPASPESQEKPSESQPAAKEEEKSEDKPSEPVSEQKPSEPQSEEKPSEPESEDKPSEEKPSEPESEVKPSEEEPSTAEPAGTEETSESQAAGEEGEKSEEKPVEGDEGEQQKEE